MYCLTCGYALSHLATCRCPECGGHFDPSDPQTYLASRRRNAIVTLLTRVAWTYLVLLGTVTLLGTVMLLGLLLVCLFMLDSGFSR